MTTFGKWFLLGSGLLFLLILLVLLHTVLFWVGVVACAGGLLYLTFRLWGHVHTQVLERQLHAAEVAKARAAVDHARAEVDKVRAEAAALWNQTKLIPQHAVGIMLDTPEQAALQQVWTFSQQTGTHKTEINLLDGEEDRPKLPVAPDFRALKGEIGPNHFLLGTYLDQETNKTRPLWANLDSIISLVAIGQQGLGKTTLARSLALQQVIYGGELHVVDYFNDVASEMRSYFPHCYTEPAEIEAYAETVLFPEMARREAAYKALDRQFSPLLLLVDEWRSLRPDCPLLAEALEHGFTDWRKLNFRMALFSVQLERADLGVSKSAASTVALFNANENLARTWGYGGKEMLEALRTLRTAGPGHCVVSGQTLQRYADLIAVPNVSPALFREILLEERRDIRDRVREGAVQAERQRAQSVWESLFTPATAHAAAASPAPVSTEDPIEEEPTESEQVAEISAPTPLERFLDERCILRKGLETPSRELWNAYLAWSDAQNETPVSRWDFGQALAQCGCTPDRRAQGERVWCGIKLKGAEVTAVTQ